MAVRLIQVTNVSTSVTKEQLRGLFAHLGRIEEIQLYPESETLSATIAAKVGYIRFPTSDLAQAALNLTSTIFLDRPILCSLVKPSSSSSSSRIPDELEAVKFCAPINSNVSLLPNGPTWPHNVINRRVTIQAHGSTPLTQFIETIDSNLTERSLPAYPPLPGTTDPVKAEEIRRTVYVSNLDPRVTLEHLHDLFTQIGEIKYIRMTKSVNDVEYENLGFTSNIKIPEGVDVTSDSVGAYIEFSEQPFVVKALCLNGLNLANRKIKVNHSVSSVIIPADVKEQVSLEELRKESAKLASSSKKHSSSSSHRDSHHRHGTSGSSRHNHRKSSHRSSRHDKHTGSASDSSSPVTEDENESSESSGDSEASSPPRKQRRSSRSRSESKSKQKHQSSSSKQSRDKDKEKERDRDRDRDRDKEKEKEKKDKEKDRDREKHRDRDRERSERDKTRSSASTSTSSSKKRKEEKSASSSLSKKEKKSKDKRDKSKERSSKSSIDADPRT